MVRGFQPALNKELTVDIEELNLVTGVLLDLLKDKEDLEGVKEIAEQWHDETSMRLNAIEDIKGGKRSIRQYKQFLILEYLKKHGGIEGINRRELIEYAEISSYDILYAYLGEMIQDGLIDFDLNDWSKHAGSFMRK